ncbi:MAG: hypothetical protein NTZ01_04350 [Verrucomicrobia bacterium]|nr:hypothetical protein [Verrucomicrobiota bacterium]
MMLLTIPSDAPSTVHARRLGQSFLPLAPLFQNTESNRRLKIRQQVARCWDLLEMEEERKPTDFRI